MWKSVYDGGINKNDKIDVARVVLACNKASIKELFASSNQSDEIFRVLNIPIKDGLSRRRMRKTGHELRFKFAALENVEPGVKISMPIKL